MEMQSFTARMPLLTATMQRNRREKTLEFSSAVLPTQSPYLSRPSGNQNETLTIQEDIFRSVAQLIAGTPHLRHIAGRGAAF